MIAVRWLAVFVGLGLASATILSAIKTVVLPRATQSWLPGILFRMARRAFRLLAHDRRSFEARDAVMAMYAPVTLLLLPVVWVVLTMVSYTAMFWGVGYGSWSESWWVSGSSLLTLGFAPANSGVERLLAFSEATIGLGLVALLIAFLPTIYGIFSKRETMVTLLDVRAGTPPSAIEFLIRHRRIGWWDELATTWVKWEEWFADIQEAHTSYPALNFLRSPQPELNWINAAGAILDAASLYVACVDDDAGKAPARVLVRAGFISLRRIADFFGVPYPRDPAPGDPIAITRTEFDAALEALAEGGVPLISDRDAAWEAFAGWRVNYDSVVLELAEIVMAPYAPWVADRSAVAAVEPNVTRWGRRRS